MPTAAFGLTIPRALLAIAYEVIEKQCSLLRCMSPFMALFGPRAMSDMSRLCAAKRTLAVSNLLPGPSRGNPLGVIDGFNTRC